MLRITLLSAFWSNESHKPLVEHAIAKWHCMEWWSGHLPWNQTSAAVSACRERLYQACWMLTHQVSCLGKHCSLCHWVSRYDEKEHNFACSLPCHGHIKTVQNSSSLGLRFLHLFALSSRHWVVENRVIRILLIFPKDRNGVKVNRFQSLDESWRNEEIKNAKKKKRIQMIFKWSQLSSCFLQLWQRHQFRVLTSALKCMPSHDTRHEKYTLHQMYRPLSHYGTTSVKLWSACTMHRFTTQLCWKMWCPDALPVWMSNRAKVLYAASTSSRVEALRKMTNARPTDFSFLKWFWKL